MSCAKGYLVHIRNYVTYLRIWMLVSGRSGISMVTIRVHRDISMIRPVLIARRSWVCHGVDCVMLGPKLVGSVSTDKGQNKSG